MASCMSNWLPPVPIRLTGEPSAIYQMLASERSLAGAFGIIAGTFAGCMPRAALVSVAGPYLGLVLSYAFAFTVGMCYAVATDITIETRPGLWAIVVGTVVAFVFGLTVHWVLGAVLGTVAGMVVGAHMEKKIKDAIDAECYEPPQFSKPSKIMSEPRGCWEPPTARSQELKSAAVSEMKLETVSNAKDVDSDMGQPAPGGDEAQPVPAPEPELPALQQEPTVCVTCTPPRSAGSRGDAGGAEADGDTSFGLTLLPGSLSAGSPQPAQEASALQCISPQSSQRAGGELVQQGRPPRIKKYTLSNKGPLIRGRDEPRGATLPPLTLARSRPPSDFSP